jgi:hypothetical protein
MSLGALLHLCLPLDDQAPNAKKPSDIYRPLIRKGNATPQQQAPNPHAALSFARKQKLSGDEGAAIQRRNKTGAAPITVLGAGRDKADGSDPVHDSRLLAGMEKTTGYKVLDR